MAPWDMFTHIRHIDFKGLERHVAQASSLPVWAASLPPKCSAGKDARGTGGQVLRYDPHSSRAASFRFCACIGTMDALNRAYAFAKDTWDSECHLRPPRST